MRPAASCFVYTLEGPDGAVRYVGLTSAPEARLLQHRYVRGNTPLAQWIQGVRAAGYVVTMRLVGEYATKRAGLDAEKALIRHCLKVGAPIFNCPPKGAEGPCWVIVDETGRACLKSRAS